MSKATIRVPLDQFAYIEIEMDDYTTESLLAKYREIVKEFKGGSGLEKKDLDRVLDRYLWGDGSMEIAEYEAMDDTQKELIQTIKRSRNRVKGREAKLTNK